MLRTTYSVTKLKNKNKKGMIIINKAVNFHIDINRKTLNN